MRSAQLIFGALLLCLSLHHAAALTCADCAGSCCNTISHGVQCYDPAMYTCNPEVLCPNMFPRACGSACYRDSEYTCASGQLVQNSQGSTSTPSTQAPTQAPSITTTTTRAPTTQAPTTQTPTTTTTTRAPTTQIPSTQAPTTTTTRAPTTQAPTTQAPTTQAPTTQAPTTQAPTTQAPTTQAPTTQTPTTQAPTTQTPTTQGPSGGPTPLNGFCASRTDCAGIGQQCCETTHPATGVTESECYDPTKFRCNAKVMCPIELLACEYSCYNGAYLQCTNGQLSPKQK